MKGVEADPGRKRKIKQRLADRPDSGEIAEQTIGDQAVVLEKDQHAEIGRDARGRRQPRPWANHRSITRHAGDARRKEQQSQKPRLLPSIENKARRQQPFNLPAPHRGQVVDEGDDSEKDAENRAVEQHARVNAESKRVCTSFRSTFGLHHPPFPTALRHRAARLHHDIAGTSDRYPRAPGASGIRAGGPPRSAET